jgi:glycerate 2-kinase
MISKSSQTQLASIFDAALAAVDPYQAVCRHTDSIRSLYEKDRFKRLYVFGFGKAAKPMLRAITEALGKKITGGLAITKYGYGSEAVGPIEIYEAGHPLPDKEGMKATKGIINQLKDFDEHTLGLCLISGGGSALLVAPYPGISLEEKVRTTDLLLKAGADIDALNTVRKHISRIKGGRLAEQAFPGALQSLILSDVIGDKLDVIASGPTAPDRTTYKDALEIIKRYGLMRKIPQSVLNVLSMGAAGKIAETPKEGSPFFRRVNNTIIGSNQSALKAAEIKARRMGYETTILSSQIRGEAREMGRWLAGKALETQKALGLGRSRKICLLSGGETTVTVMGQGKGGRNMELALAFALEASQTTGITLLSAGTDGTDGPTDAAGAVADGQTISQARAMGLEVEGFLDNNDSYHFFAETKDLFITGPTDTNVMDLQIILIDS